MRGSRGLRMIGGAFFDGVLCGEGMLLSGERGEREKGEGAYGGLRFRPLRLRLELEGLRILSRRRGWGIFRC